MDGHRGGALVTSLAGHPEVLLLTCPLCLFRTSATWPSGASLVHLAAALVGWWKETLFQRGKSIRGQKQELRSPPTQNDNRI